jgi:hypothetical protein
MLHNSSSVRARSVRFQGVDWATEEEKAQQGHESRRKAREFRQRRKQEKLERKRKDLQLLSFPRFSVNNNNNNNKDYNDDDQQPAALSMDYCDVWLRHVKSVGFMDFPDDLLSRGVKVERLIESFDFLKTG